MILSASDTVLGLFAQLSEKSKKKLDMIKQRNVKPYIVLLSSVANLDTFVDQNIDESMKKIMATYWPGPLTIVFKAKRTLPSWLKGADNTIAIRIPDHERLQQILQHVDGLFTTSANVTDQPLPLQLSEVNQSVVDQVALVSCDHNRIYNGLASTILDFSAGSVRIIRQGSVTIDSM